MNSGLIIVVKEKPIEWNCTVANNVFCSYSPPFHYQQSVVFVRSVSTMVVCTIPFDCTCFLPSVDYRSNSFKRSKIKKIQIENILQYGTHLTRSPIALCSIYKRFMSIYSWKAAGNTKNTESYKKIVFTWFLQQQHSLSIKQRTEAAMAASEVKSTKYRKK